MITKEHSRGKEENVGKIAFWYTFSNFLTNGIVFLATPFFTRLMSKSEYGIFSNYSAWLVLLAIVTSVDLHESINRAKYDLSEDIEAYLSSILAVTSTVTIFIYLFVEWQSKFFVEVFDLDMPYIRLLFLVLLFNPALLFLQQKSRIFQKYKTSIFLTVISSVPKTLTAVGLVIFMDDKLEARILGDALPAVIINFLIYIYIMFRGRKISWRYIRYALLYSAPLIPHALAGNILLTSDRIMVKYFCGAEWAAMYTISSTSATVVSILWFSMNQAWGPWVYDRLAYGGREKIAPNSRVYLSIFLALVIGILLIMPEFVLVMGGKSYYEARYVIPPICVGYVCQFVYSMYVNIEFFCKKTVMISINTFITAVVNIILNAVFIPRFGYEAAAYTSFAGYACMFLLHYITVTKVLKYRDIYDNRFNFIVIIAATALLPLYRFLYGHSILRYAAIVLYATAFISIVFKNRHLIFSYLNKTGHSSL